MPRPDTPPSSARIAGAIDQGCATKGVAVAAYLTGGYPEHGTFMRALNGVLDVADLVEIGVPFSDPMADGVTIQRASARALEHGVTPGGLLELIAGVEHGTPIVLMSYLNPILAFGIDRFATTAFHAGVSGIIIPDLPLEESAPYRASLDDADVSLIQLVTPQTPPARLDAICEVSRGFTYAVTMTGTTGGTAAIPSRLSQYLRRVRDSSPVPVLAGFGIRSAEQVRRLTGHTDGVIVGSALIEALDRGDDPSTLLRQLTGAVVPVPGEHI